MIQTKKELKECLAYEKTLYPNTFLDVITRELLNKGCKRGGKMSV
ncbi:hypothetical protein [Clostridium lacusfryxellense]|nr:hypothetical protein [Clostridium lacusfryxellense]